MVRKEGERIASSRVVKGWVAPVVTRTVLVVGGVEGVIVVV